MLPLVIFEEPLKRSWSDFTEKFMAAEVEFKPDARVQCTSGKLTILFQGISSNYWIDNPSDVRIALARRARLCTKDRLDYPMDQPVNILNTIARDYPACFVFEPRRSNADGEVGPAFSLATRKIAKDRNGDATSLCLAPYNDDIRPTKKSFSEGVVLCVPHESFAGIPATDSIDLPACPPATLEALDFPRPAE